MGSISREVLPGGLPRPLPTDRIRFKLILCPDSCCECMSAGARLCSAMGHALRTKSRWPRKVKSIHMPSVVARLRLFICIVTASHPLMVVMSNLNRVLTAHHALDVAPPKPKQATSTHKDYQHILDGPCGDSCTRQRLRYRYPSIQRIVRSMCSFF